jgi:hypothetical protein
MPVPVTIAPLLITSSSILAKWAGMAQAVRTLPLVQKAPQQIHQPQ